EGLPLDDPRRLQLEERQRDLLLSYGDEWAAPVRAVGAVQQWWFRRGFVEGVALRSTDLPAELERLGGLAPIRELRLVALNAAEVQRATRSPQLRRLRRLELTEYSLASVSGQLLASPELVNLRTLHLRRDASPGVEDAPCLAGLTTLRLGGWGRDA